MHWNPAAGDADAALAAFLPRAGSAYARTRNHDHGPDDRHNVSCLSPWLRHRLLEEPRVLAAVLARHGPQAAEKFVHEVFWRTYFKGWLEHRPGVWLRYCDELAQLEHRLQQDDGLRERHAAAVGGDTGIDCFDAWVRELRGSGYLHNHARMWFASIWIFTLRLPWQLGAAFFYRELLDADPASNTLSWRWVGGLHTRGRHYLARPDNIARYTGGRFRPEGRLDTGASPLEEETPPPSPVPVAAADPAPARQRYGLLVTAEDCRPETLPLRSGPAAVARLVMPSDAGPGAAARAWRRGPRGTAFADAATADAVRRACTHWSVDAEASAMAFTAQPQWADQLVAWAEAHDLETVVTAWAPTGEVAAALQEAAAVLERAGRPLTRVRRDYDSLAWPHATRGFFALRRQIPSMLRKLGLT